MIFHALLFPATDSETAKKKIEGRKCCKGSYICQPDPLCASMPIFNHHVEAMEMGCLDLPSRKNSFQEENLQDLPQHSSQDLLLPKQPPANDWVWGRHQGLAIAVLHGVPLMGDLPPRALHWAGQDLVRSGSWPWSLSHPVLLLPTLFFTGANSQ